MTIASPCTGNCRLDESGDRCTGCGRTMAQITAWAGMTEAERGAVMAALTGKESKDVRF